MTYKFYYKTNQFFFLLIKISIVVGAFYFIFQKLAKNEDLDCIVFYRFLIENDVLSFKIISFLLVLSIFNWFFEIQKWKILVSEIKKINFKTALEQSLSALTASLITPNRIGDYGAKAIYYKKENRKRILFINLMGNIMQMVVTCAFGIIGFYMFVLKYPTQLNHNYFTIGFLIVFVLVIFAVLIIKKSTFTYKGFSIKKLKIFIHEFDRKKIIIGFLLSLIRYSIFTFQFFFLLNIFKVEINYINAMIIISAMYFLSSIIPTIFIFDVFIKGSIALYLFSFIDVNELVILSIITLMWLLNFVLPSIAGSYYVLNYNPPIKDN